MDTYGSELPWRWSHSRVKFVLYESQSLLRKWPILFGLYARFINEAPGCDPLVKDVIVHTDLTAKDHEN